MTLLLLVGLLLSPARAATGSVCIDPGHGGDDPGAVGNGLEEDDLNLSASLHFRDWLDLDSSDGGGGGSWDAYLTRETDVYISLSGRTDYANSLGVDVFMSIHTNAGGGDGTETYAYASGGSADTLAHRVQEEVLSELGTRDRGVKYEGFYVLEYTDMPADLNEMAFIDTWDGNAELLSEDANLDLVGLAHLHALQRYMGVSEYTPSDEDPGTPTGSVAFTSVPSSVAAGAGLSVGLSYETDLYAFGERGEITVDMKDGETWTVLAETTWDNSGTGVQGPSGTHDFSFTAPTADTTSLCFVAWLSPLGGDWDDRMAQATSCTDPTEVEYDPGEGPPTWKVDLTSWPDLVMPGEPFEVEVDHEGALPDGVLAVELLETRTGRIVERQTIDTCCEAETGSHPVQFTYDGTLGSVFLHACLMQTQGGRCIAEDDNERDPIAVYSDRPDLEKGGCACSGRPGSPLDTRGVTALLTLAGMLAIRRRRATGADRPRPE